MSMTAPHPDIEAAALEFVFSLDFEVDVPSVAVGCPGGNRVCIPIKGGTFQGGPGYEDFRGDVVGPSTDWATISDDGTWLYLDVQIVFKCHDGAVVLGRVNGRSHRDPDNAGNAKVHTSLSPDTGVEKWMWMNKHIFPGKGIKEGNRIRINYYKMA